MATEKLNRVLPPLNTVQLLSVVPFYRIFTPVYVFAILALFYHHVQALIYSTTVVTSSLTFIFIISDLVLALMWFPSQTSRLCAIQRKEFPENLDNVIDRSDYPALDVFICTADPTKEPPMSVVNTALSVMAYDYPTEKLSVYISDDGGSVTTLFAFIEAAKFATHWLPFCRENNVTERSPEAYFRSDYDTSSNSHKIKVMYESMKARVERVVERGEIGEDHITSDEHKDAFNKWNHKFTRDNHPTIIHVLSANNKSKDINGTFMPNLIYVSREKSKTTNHHFKAGALNVLLRVSAAMTNAPIILSLDCDTKSNNPQTPLRVLCYYSDPEIRSKYAFVQFPQHFEGINKNDTYACRFKRTFEFQAMGFDGLRGTNFAGTGCFFSRRAFFGGPSSLVSPEIVGLNPFHVVDKPIQSQHVLALAYQVAGCNYEYQTSWGSKMGFRYGSLVEDLFTSYKLHCEGWKSIFCNPHRPAFSGYAPISLVDLLVQCNRWVVGLLEMGFSNYSPIIYGIKYLGPLMALAYAQYAFWAIWSIPIITYAFLPQLALLNNVSVFPKVSEAWFLLYLFLFLGAYGQDLLDFIVVNGTFRMWWNDQRMWIIRGITSLFFASFEFFLKSLGISSNVYNVTSKVVDDKQRQRYEQEKFEFGVPLPMFVPLTMAAFINLVSFTFGLAAFCKGRNLEGLLLQMLIAAFGVINSWPIYEAIFLRKDKGKLPAKITITSIFFTWGLYIIASFLLKR